MSRPSARVRCSATSQSGTTSATVNANSNGGVLSVSVGLDNVDCNNAVNHNYVATSATVTFDVTPATGRTNVTLKIAAASVNKLWFQYEVCFSSPNSSFVNKYGAAIAPGQAGILPSCFLNCDRPIRWAVRPAQVVRSARQRLPALQRSGGGSARPRLARAHGRPHSRSSGCGRP